MSSTRKVLVVCFVMVCIGFVTPAWTQAPSGSAKAPEAAAPAVDEEELFDQKLRELGYWAGAAWGCVPEDKQVDIDRQVLDTFNNIARLFGTDRAFFFAAAFGRGTTEKVEAAKCPEFLEKFKNATALRGGR